MLNIFKQIKQLKMTKEQLEQENSDLREALGRANTANREMGTEFRKLSNELNGSIERIKFLNGQIKMMDAQKQASEKYNDNNRNY